MRPQREKLINVAQALVTVASSLLESLQAETAETECSETVPAKAAAAESSEEDFEIVPPFLCYWQQLFWWLGWPINRREVLLCLV